MEEEREHMANDSYNKDAKVKAEQLEKEIKVLRRSKTDRPLGTCCGVQSQYMHWEWGLDISGMS
jgi:hypothetical protein